MCLSNLAQGLECLADLPQRGDSNDDSLIRLPNSKLTSSSNIIWLGSAKAAAMRPLSLSSNGTELYRNISSTGIILRMSRCQGALGIYGDRRNRNDTDEPIPALWLRRRKCAGLHPHSRGLTPPRYALRGTPL